MCYIFARNDWNDYQSSWQAIFFLTNSLIDKPSFTYFKYGSTWHIFKGHMKGPCYIYLLYLYLLSWH